MAEIGGIDLAVIDCEPVPELGHPLEIRSQEQPVRFGRAGRQAIGDRRIIECQGNGFAVKIASR